MAGTELVDIVDENNNVVGSTDADTAHNQKIMHRVAGVFVFNADGDIYVQTGNKYGKMDLSVGGHVQKGESYENAAQREMFEELGLETPIRHVSTFFPVNARLNHYWAIYATTAPIGWKFQETEEVKSVEKIGMSEVVAMMESNPDAFTHGFINAMKEFMRVKEAVENDTYYQKLKKLSENGRLSMYVIVAPPRTNSSLVEHAMGNSPDVKNECHEPFLEARHDNFKPDYGYKQIYESIGGEQFEKSDRKTSVVVKEMSHWIGVNEEYKRLATLATGPIVVLIRNPLLSVESRIRRVLMTIDMRYNIDIQRYLLDDIAIEKGFSSWANLAGAVGSGAYNEYSDIIQSGEGVERLYDTPILTVQNRLLDIKAHKHDYANWRDLVERKLYTERDYTFFEGILKANKRRLKFEKEEFKKLAEEVKYFKDHGQSYVVFDTTDLRAAPDEQLRELCSRAGISFSPEMLQWGKRSVDFHTEQEKQSEKLWYDALFSSDGVNAPVEIPPVLAMFPGFMQEYLRTYNLPIYTELSKNKIIREFLKHELNEKKFNVRITASNNEQLRKLGAIGEDVSVGQQVSVKLKYIDPVYAVTNEPGLIKNLEFIKFRDWYADELKIVSDTILLSSFE